jgi:hypothetical protein
MVHTYRHARLGRTQKIIGLLLAAVYVFVCGGLFVMAVIHAIAPGWEGRVSFAGNGGRWEGAVVAAVLVFIAGMMFEGWRRSCHEIRLSDDGTCELETKRRVIRFHVSEISAVEYDGSDGESYTIRYRRTKMYVSGLEPFPDFIARLESLNPAVDLSGFPPDWPDREAA